MPVPPRGYRVNKTHCGAAGGSPGFLGRLRELAQDEDDPAGLLCAVVRARVKAQAERTDSPRHRQGQYANGTTICRDSYWAASLDMGRALLMKAKPKSSKVPREVDGQVLTDEERAWFEGELRHVDWGSACRHLRDRRMAAQ